MGGPRSYFRAFLFSVIDCIPENSSDRNIVSKKYLEKSAESVPLVSQPTGPIKVAKTNQNCNEILDDRDTKWSNTRTTDKDTQVSVIDLCNTESVIDATKAGKDYVKRVDVNKLDYKCLRFAEVFISAIQCLWFFNLSP